MVTVADQKTLRKTYEATVQELFFTLFSTGHPSVIRQKYLSWAFKVIYDTSWYLLLYILCNACL